MATEDFVGQLRTALVILLDKSDEWDPWVQAVILAWVAMAREILDGAAPKTTQRIQQGQVAPAADDLATGAGR